MPAELLDLWAELATPRPARRLPGEPLRRGARMGLHQDRDEADFGFPVLSVSLGDTAIFRLGGARRKDADPQPCA